MLFVLRTINDYILWFFTSKVFSSIVTLKDHRLIKNWVITKVNKNIKVKINFKKTQSKKFNKKIKAKIKLIRDAILAARIRLIQV